jgi:hypothetical protein
LAPAVTQLAATAMCIQRRSADTARMENYIYQRVHGHIVINLSGRHCVLDTGSAVSIGYYPIIVNGREFEVQDSYFDVTCEFLSREIGVTVEGLIGADIIREFTLGIYPVEQIVQFDEAPAYGSIVVPIRNFMDVPILRFGCEGRVLSAFLDTGATLSYLLPEMLEGLPYDGVQEDFYPLLGNFLTPVYRLPVSLGGETVELKFGRLPDELLPVLAAGNVKAILGTGLLRHFGLCLSIRDKVLKLERSSSRLAA